MGKVKYPICVEMYLNTDKCVVFCSSLYSENLKIELMNQNFIIVVGGLFYFIFLVLKMKQETHSPSSIQSGCPTYSPSIYKAAYCK